MLDTQTCSIHCPYCGEVIQIVVDPSVPEQSYVEDCFVCCKPIALNVYIDNDENIHIAASHQDEC